MLKSTTVRRKGFEEESGQELSYKARLRCTLSSAADAGHVPNSAEVHASGCSGGFLMSFFD
jgi:hypothetical protein